ncbi:MAG: type restriction enzyme subunit, partial [Campylobacterota bacterium]|nr:type restriction enzyme subunit [Campylobacterota bacterium]
LLEQYKKGVMQKIFSQKLRFRDDDGVEYPEWVEKKLGEVAECLDNLRKPLNDEERQKIKGNIPYWGANNIMGYVNDYLFDETIVLLAEDGGNFNEYKTRPIANISYGKCWVNNHTHVLRGKKNILINEFLFYSLVHKNITAYVSGGTRAKLTKGEMLKIKIDMPTLNEQSKIANFLSSIDTKISQTEQQLEATKQFKKALLQKMFV